MANDRKRGFLSSLFGRRKLTEQEEMEALESRQRLEARIEQILAEKAVVREIIAETSPVALVLQKEEPEPEVELFPISASVLGRRKERVPSVFMLSTVESGQPFALREN
jgi:hypothetical protein